MTTTGRTHVVPSIRGLVRKVVFVATILLLNDDDTTTFLALKYPSTSTSTSTSTLPSLHVDAWTTTRIMSSRPTPTSTSTMSRTNNRLTMSTTSTTTASTSSSSSSSPWFDDSKNDEEVSASSSSPSPLAPSSSSSMETMKIQILQLGAALDRGQAYNPTSGAYYEETMKVAKSKIQNLVDMARTLEEENKNNYNDNDNDGNNDNNNNKNNDNAYFLPRSLQDMEGEWELVLSTVPHGIFRSSPFFLAIQESYEYEEEEQQGGSGSTGSDKANLFFRLHELQTCSWGTSKIGRVAQRIDAKRGYLYSEFDTSIFSLTVIPILGWFKLLPTFGGCVVTASKCELKTDGTVGQLDMEVDYTTSRKVPGLSGLPLIGDIIWKLNVPVGAIWKLLPWNKGRAATCKVYVKYLDQDFRIVQDIDGEYFVYTRPVVSRPLDI